MKKIIQAQYIIGYIEQEIDSDVTSWLSETKTNKVKKGIYEQILHRFLAYFRRNGYTFSSGKKVKEISQLKAVVTQGLKTYYDPVIPEVVIKEETIEYYCGDQPPWD